MAELVRGVNCDYEPYPPHAELKARIAELEAALRDLAEQAAEMAERLDTVFDAEAEAIATARKLVKQV